MTGAPLLTKGMRYMLLATLLFSVMQVLVKYLDNYHFSQLILFRAGISLVICTWTIRREKRSFLGINKPLLFARGAFGVVSLMCFFYALQHAPIASVVTIVNIKPFLILLIGAVVLKENISPLQWGMFAVSFAGIVVIKGFDTGIDQLSFLAILGAACFAAVAHTIVRKLRETDVPVVILFYFTVVTVPLVGPIAIHYWKTPEGMDWLYLAAIGVITHFAQLLLTKAYQADEVSKVSNIYYLGIVFAMVYGYFLFDEGLTLATLGGIGLVVGGIFGNMAFAQKK